MEAEDVQYLQQGATVIYEQFKPKAVFGNNAKQLLMEDKDF
jgi:hypothetical protein